MKMDRQLIVSDELHKLIKIRASEEGKSIKGLVTKVFKNYLGIKSEDNGSNEE